MKPTIPGLQNSWNPAVYPLPQQAAAAPPGLDPSAVYSFGNGVYGANTGFSSSGKKDPGFVQAQMPAIPAAPGYLGPYSAQAYQMAGPRVGFTQAPVGAPVAPPAAPAGGPQGPTIGPGGGGMPVEAGAGTGLPAGRSLGMVDLLASGAQWNPGGTISAPPSGSSVFGPGIDWGTIPGITDANKNPDLMKYLGGGLLTGALLPEMPASSALPGGTPTLSGAPMAPSNGQWAANLGSGYGDGGGGMYNLGTGSWSSPAYTGGWGSNYGSNNFGGGNWSSFGSGAYGGFGGAGGVNPLLDLVFNKK